MHSKPYYLSLSTLIHLVIFLLIGGVVLFKTEIEPPDFAAGSGDSFLIKTEDSSALPPAATSPSLPTAGSFPIQTPTPSIAAITTTAPGEISLKFPKSLPVSVKELTRSIQGKLASLRTNISMPTVSEHWRSFFGSRTDPSRSMLHSSAQDFAAGTRKPRGSLVGVFYDLKQTKDGKDSGVDDAKYREIVTRFGNEGFPERILTQYFRAETPLYSSRIMIPEIQADEGPKAFGFPDIQPSRWVVHYKGKVSPPQSGTYRFVGAGDDVLFVKFDGRLILDRSYNINTQWRPSQLFDYHTGYREGFAVSDPVSVSAGRWYDIEILIGEERGYQFQAVLLVGEEGVNYDKDEYGNPILPVFRFTDEPLPELEEGLQYAPHMPDGPVWSARPGVPSGAQGLDAFR